MTEVWKDVLGYEGLYQISDRGRVKNARSGRVLKPHLLVNGYIQTMLSRGGKRRQPLVHRLVAEAFLPTPAEEQNQINHKNGNKTDNRVENLEWCTAGENNRHRRHVLMLDGGGRPKRPVLCKETGTIYPSVNEAARRTGASRNGILRCCHGEQTATRNKLHFNFMEE